ESLSDGYGDLWSNTLEGIKKGDTHIIMLIHKYIRYPYKDQLDDYDHIECITATKENFKEEELTKKMVSKIKKLNYCDGPIELVYCGKIAKIPGLVEYFQRSADSAKELLEYEKTEMFQKLKRYEHQAAKSTSELEIVKNAVLGKQSPVK
ncbi:MAG: hypothetical protein FWD32_02825, partial [Firmicutes bacterium]|nr:hypothetical protein [Bacillota bacterium]